LDESFEEELCEDSPLRRLKSILFSHYARALSLSLSLSLVFLFVFCCRFSVLCSGDLWKKKTRCDPWNFETADSTLLKVCYIPSYVLLISSIFYHQFCFQALQPDSRFDDDDDESLNIINQQFVSGLFALVS
jgi:hypothetical protein